MSSNVSDSTYDKDTQALTITFGGFKGNRTYIYTGVPPDVASDFANSSSKGKFVHDVLGFYPYSRA